QQLWQTVFRFDFGEIRALRPQSSEERFVVLGYALTDDGDAESAEWKRRFGRHSRTQFVGVDDGGAAKSVQLVRGPQMGGQLLDELCREIYPIEALKVLRQLDLREGLKPTFELVGRKRAKVGDFLVE